MSREQGLQLLKDQAEILKQQLKQIGLSAADSPDSPDGEIDPRKRAILDSAPGIGCPVIASLSGATAAPIVTEPTLLGIHDMERVLGLARRFRTQALICINKFDLNETMTHRTDRGLRSRRGPRSF